jgi:hypothetical protein
LPEKIKIWSKRRHKSLQQDRNTKKTERTMAIADNGKRETDAQDSQKPSQRSNFSARIGERRPGTQRAGRRPHLACRTQQRLIDEHGRRSPLARAAARGWNGTAALLYKATAAAAQNQAVYCACASYDRIRVRAARVRTRGGAVQKASKVRPAVQRDGRGADRGRALVRA